MDNQLAEQFVRIFGRAHTKSYFAPGRVNLIGEHIDYNGGLVMPCAITFGTYMLLAPNNESVFRFRSLNFKETLDIEIRPDGYTKMDKNWYNYPLGVIDRLIKAGHVPQGIDILYWGNIPIGSGLSSSASIEIVTAYALNELIGAGISKLDLVKLAKDVENIFIGLNSGIMDQFAVAFGQKDKAMQLNCDTLNYEVVDCNLDGYLLAIINTNKVRALAESKYNERVMECNEALNVLKSAHRMQYLCDMDTKDFAAHQHLIANDIVRKRAKHVVEENVRVKEAAKALAAGNLTAFGRLMYASHDSLRHLYEVSGIELDTIVDYCISNKHVAGARMTGAGFGGCAIALVQKEYFDSFSEELIQYYQERIGYTPTIYSSLIGDGVKALPQTLLI
ncbi:MAG: galactokinase [Bacteroidetes bacterium]|nr:galactokinase [Bacteroidota bacterium]